MIRDGDGAMKKYVGLNYETINEMLMKDDRRNDGMRYDERMYCLKLKNDFLNRSYSQTS